MITFAAWVAGNVGILWGFDKLTADDTSDPIGQSWLAVGALAVWNIGVAVYAFS